MSETKNVIAMERICKRYKETVALDDFSLSVPAGTVFSLLGENGAGKTTAIKIMLGMVEPEEGRSQVLGFDSKREDLEIRRKVGYVPEQSALYDWMTVGEIGWFAAGFYPQGYWREFARLVNEYRLPADRKIASLSKGMRAKVSLSLALAHDPELLILDEPTSGLDALVRREFLESMVDRAATGKTVFLSSHQIQEVERVSDYVAILRDAKLLLVERLDVLKANTRVLRLTLTDDRVEHDEEPDDVSIPFEQVLRQHRHGRQIEVVGRGLAENAGDVLQADPKVAAFEWRVPTLEEIFVACMEGKESTTRQWAASLSGSVH